MSPNDKINVYQQIQGMTVAEKVKFAMHAGKEARSALLKDPNKQVALSVVNSPKITEEEVLIMAQSKTTNDEVLRIIIKNREWMKKYAICLALIGNPKTPLGIAVSLLPKINKRDLVLLSKSKSVPEAVRANGKRVLLKKEN